MRVLMLPVGSAGDVHPHVGIGAALAARGHDVSVLANPHFESTVAAAGLRLIPWGTTEEFDTATRNPDLWHPRRGVQVVSSTLLRGMPLMYDAVAAEAARGEVLLVAHGLAFGARLARETLGLPLVTLHLQPSFFVSAHDTPVLHPSLRSINDLPDGVKRLVLRLADRKADSVFVPAIRELAEREGQPPVRHVASRWWHSPQRVIGLFPEWLAPPQPDWPDHTVLTGFPLFDDARGEPLAPDVEAFLAAGEPPVVFAPGSPNRQAAGFLRAAVEACQALGRRALLVTPFTEQLPTPRPDGVAAWDYVPFGQLFPRAAAIVHHGGIGTSAQALAAGRPQVVMPMTFDQPDNAARLERLGVARTIWPRSFHGPQLADVLAELLADRDVQPRATELAARIAQDDPVTRTCEIIEDVGATSAPDAA